MSLGSVHPTGVCPFPSAYQESPKLGVESPRQAYTRATFSPFRVTFLFIRKGPSSSKQPPDTRNQLGVDGMGTRGGGPILRLLGVSRAVLASFS